MFLKMLGTKPLELTMPWLRGGPYTVEPGTVFEVDDGDGAALLEGNERLFEQASVPPSASPAVEKTHRRKKGASEAAEKDG